MLTALPYINYFFCTVNFKTPHATCPSGMRSLVQTFYSNRRHFYLLYIMMPSARPLSWCKTSVLIGKNRLHELYSRERRTPVEHQKHCNVPANCLVNNAKTVH